MTRKAPLQSDAFSYIILKPQSNNSQDFVSQVVGKTKEVAAKAVSTEDGADELKKYKDLYDQGVLTEEEFEAKKKQILGL